MVARAFLETFLAVALTLVVGVGAVMIGSLAEGLSLPEAFDAGTDALNLVAITLPVVAILWLIVNLVARRSSSAARFGWNVLALFIATTVASIVWFVTFALIVAGWGGLLAVIAIIATAGLFLAATIALVLVHFVFIRRRKAPVAPAPVAPNANPPHPPV